MYDITVTSTGNISKSSSSSSLYSEQGIPSPPLDPTPSHFLPPVRVIDDDYDADGVAELLVPLQMSQVMSRQYGIEPDMSCDEIIEHIANAIPTMWTLQDDQG